VISCENGWKNIWRSRTGIPLLLAALFFACPRTERNSRPPPDPGPPRVVIETAAKEKVTVIVELAITPTQKQQGMMYRKELAEDRGMLFLFAYTGNQTFWMRNTYLPLDIIFIGEDLEIKGIVENAQPESESILTIDKPCRYVLEVNGGFCQKFGVKTGDKVKLRGMETPS